MSFIQLEERTPAWHEFRRGKIGGSEIAALFGAEDISDGNDDGDAEEVMAGYTDSIYALYYIKSGIVEPRPVESEVVDAGILMEPFIAQRTQAVRGWKVMNKGRYAVDDTTPGMGASIDYEVFDAGEDAKGVSVGGRIMRAINGQLVGPGVYQIKNVSERQFYKKWTEGQPPLYVILQVQHELACSGYQWGCLGAWIGGNKLRLWFYERHEGIIAEIRKRVTEFWQLIADKRPPQPDGSSSSDYVLRQLYPTLKDTLAAPIDLSGNNELPGLLEEFEEHRDKRLEHEKEEKDRRNRIKGFLGNATHGWCGGKYINVSVTPENPGRKPLPGEVIGKKSEVRTLRVSDKAPTLKKAKK